MVRSFLNSSEELGAGEKARITVEYAGMLLNSGYSLQKNREILIRGIKGYESKLRRCQESGVPIRKKAKESSQARMRKKLTAKTNWYKKRKIQEDTYQYEPKSKRKKLKKEMSGGAEIQQKTVLFVEQTRKGE